MLVAVALAADVSVFTDGPLPADGNTDSVVQVVVPGLGDGDEVGITARGAKVVAEERGPQGTINVTLRPVPVDAPASVGLTVRGKGAVTVDVTLEVPVAPVTGALELSFDPPALQGDGGVLVKVRPARGDIGELALGASIGKVGVPARNADGSWTALYSPPAGLERPTGVLFTAVDLVAPERVVGLGVLPIRVRVVRALPAPPGVQATLKVGDRTYGPVVASAGGAASFPVELWPGDATGSLSWVNDEGKTTTITVDLENPAVPQVAFAPWPVGTGLPGGEPVTLWLAATDASGAPRERLADLVVDGPSARPLPGEDGWHRIEIVPPVEPGNFRVVATIGLVDASLSLRSVPPRAVIDLRATPEVPGQANAVQITAGFASGRGGRPDSELTVDVLDAPFAPSDGSVAIDLTGLPGATVVAGTSFEPSGLPPARLRVWTGRPWFSSREIVPLYVVVEDALGLPVPGQIVSLRKGPGLLKVPETVDTGPEGWVVVPIGRFDDKLEPIPIGAGSGALSAGTVLWPDAVAMGTAEDAYGLSRWGRALPTLRVRRDGPPEGTGVAPIPNPPSRVEAVAAVEEPEKEPRKKPRKPPPNLDAFTWRVGGGYADAGIRSRQTSTDPDVVEDARFRNPLPFGAVGVFGRAEGWHRSGFGAELTGRIGSYKFLLAGQDFKDTAGDWVIGARYRAPIDDHFGWQVLAGLERTDLTAFVLDSDGQTPLDRVVPVTGLRVGGAGTYTGGIVEVQLQLAETFAIAPAITDVAARVDVALPWTPAGLGLYATGGIDFSFRYLTRNLTAGRAHLEELQGVVTIGIAVGSPP